MIENQIMIKKIIFQPILFIFFVTSCATTGDGLPSTRVITDTQGVEMQKYNQDLYACRQYAAQVNVGSDALAGLIAGALVGAAIGAARQTAQWVLEPLRPSTLPPDPKREYGPSGRVSEKEYLRMCADTRGVLLHALKW